ncbi:MAG TPA: 2-dehydropantoate 2-reductase [Candidatus Polarisedimenticolia bacterium]|nr:2-dehydropantoate 2-reductase [Candidatus Polarisedimenticolia bacterium]
MSIKPPAEPPLAETIGIVGGGALGTLLASRFLARGAEVRIVTRSGGSRHDDLKREHPEVRLGHDFAALEGAALIFLCVKAFHTRDVARSLGSLKLATASVCSLQNGWGNLELLDQALPSLPLLAGATSLGAYLDDRGLLHATDRGTTVVAPWRPADFGAAERAAHLIRATGLLSEARPDARAVLWRKLVLNSAVNPVTALGHCTNGALLQEPALFEIARGAAREAARVGARLGLLDPDFDPEDALRAILRETAGNLSSMREDLARGRRTEVEEITGAVVRLAQQTGESAPVQNALLTLLRAAERRL